MSPRRPLLVNADDLEQWSDRYEAAAKPSVPAPTDPLGLEHDSKAP